jgi:hypothetical protein
MFKKILMSGLMVLGAQSMVASAHEPGSPTRIIETKISYARALQAADRQGIPVYMAAIGGQIVFEGSAPVFATLKMGGQIYTVATDRQGFYSAFVYTNGYNEFTVEGWSPNEAPEHRILPIVEGVIK